MMAADIAEGVFKVAELIYDRVQLVKANKSQCERLVERIRVIEVAVSGLEEIPESDHFKKGLALLEKCLRDSLKFIDQFMEGQKWYHQAIKAAKNESQFNDLNQRLRDALPLLNVGISAQQITNREQDIADQKADAKELKAGQAEIISLNQKMLRELQEFKGAAAQRDMILARQLASLKGQLYQIHQPVEIKSLIPLDYKIPYCELIFDGLIGQGSISRVYKGRWEGQAVAIKLLSVPLSGADGIEFSREVAIMNRLRNPCIVQFYGACLEEDNACLVMENMVNGSLYAQLEKTQLTLPQQKQIALDIARGLQYLHKNGMIHRDLKSANILLTANFHAKVANFGLTKTRSFSIQSITKVSQAVAWCAPEILKSESTVTAKADSYSFGMILWEVCTGKRPYAGLSFEALTRKILAGHRENVPELIPIEFRGLITACWSATPEKRPDMAQIIQQLEVYDPAKTIYQKAKTFEEAKDFKSAQQCYQQAADSGITSALTSLGVFALMGTGGMPKDKVKAHQLFLEAAQKGHPRAMKNLAVMLDMGDGVAQDQKQALVWYQKAGAAGDVESLKRATRLTEKLATLMNLTTQPSKFGVASS